MKKLIISGIGILILVPSIYAQQSPKQAYNSDQLKYRDIKVKIIENDQNIISNLRDIQSKKIYKNRSEMKINADPRIAIESRRDKKSLQRDKLIRISRYGVIR